MKKFLFTFLLSLLVVCAFKSDVSADGERLEGFTQYTYRITEDNGGRWANVYLLDGTFLYRYEQWEEEPFPGWGGYFRFYEVTPAVMRDPRFKAEFDYIISHGEDFKYVLGMEIEIKGEKETVPKYCFNELRTLSSSDNSVHIYVDNGNEEYTWNIEPHELAQDLKEDFSPYVTYEVNPAVLQNYYPEDTNYYLFHTSYNPEDFVTKNKEWSCICQFNISKLVINGESKWIDELWKEFYEKYCTEELYKDGYYSYGNYVEKNPGMPLPDDLGCFYMSSFERKTGNLRGAFRNYVWSYSTDPNVTARDFFWPHKDGINNINFWVWNYYASSDFVISDKPMIGCKPEYAMACEPLGQGGMEARPIDLTYFYGLEAVEDYLKDEDLIENDDAASKDFIDSSADLEKDITIETDDAIYKIDDKDIERRIPFEPTAEAVTASEADKILADANGYSIANAEVLEFTNKYNSDGLIPGDTTVEKEVDTNKFPIGSIVEVNYHNDKKNRFELIASAKVYSKGGKGYISYKVPHFSTYALCSECDHSWGDEKIVKPATCSASGITEYTCQKCKTVKMDETKKLPHNWGSSRVIKSATCCSTGEIECSCKECGAVKKETIKKDSNVHTGRTVIKNEKKATTKKKGYTGDTYCKDCHKLIKRGKTLAMLTAKTKALKLSIPSKKIAAGRSVTITPVFTPVNVKNQNLTWKSSNTKYAVVSSKGKVTTKKAGAGKTVQITAKTKDGTNKKATVKIQIMKSAVKTIKLTSAMKTLKAGKKVTIKAGFTTTKAKKETNTAVAWTSSNDQFATVSSKGKVTAKKAGIGRTVKITATSLDGTNKKGSITLRIIS